MITSAETVRICVCSPDHDLRSWVIDELSLMTWIGSLRIETVASLAIADLRPEDRDLLIVGLDSLEPSQVELLRGRTWLTPAIGIGHVPDGIQFDRTLASRATSRELRQALRELLVRATR